MITSLISPQGLKGMIDSALYAQLQAEKRVTEEYRNLLAQMFTDLVNLTPQWSGNLARNWQITASNLPRATYIDRSPWMQAKHGRTSPYKMSDDPAVTETLDRELPKLAEIYWNSKVTFVNKTPYSEEVQAGLGPQKSSSGSRSNPDVTEGERLNIREVNLGPNGQVMMLTYIKQYYNDQGITID